MIETITPDVCGSRRRQRIALVGFAAGAAGAAALLGAFLGFVGSTVGGREALVAALVLAALGALRELGALRFPLPQLRLQVPERWRADLPLPAWAVGYGAGLGIGFATFQPVATFWFACAGAIALGRPLAAAACLSSYGLGRAAMVALPVLLEPDPALAAERLLSRRPAISRANGIGLALCAIVLALTLVPVAGAGPPTPLYLGPGSQFDPSPSAGGLAYTQREFDVSTAVVRAPDGNERAFPGARTPSLDGNLVAFADDNGVRVVRWRTGEQVARVLGPLSRPALDWPWLVYRLDVYDGTKELWLRNLTSGQTVLVAAVGPNADLGRPALSAGRVVWHVATAKGSSIGLYERESGARRILARSKSSLLWAPALSDSRVIWVDQRGDVTRLRLRRLDGGPATTLVGTRDRNQAFWTTGLAGRSAYFTRWYVILGFAQIERIRF